MVYKSITDVQAKWTEEFNLGLNSLNSFYVAIFNIKSELIYANPVMLSLLDSNPVDSFINPTFSDLLQKEGNKNLIFEGYITFGNITKVNTSVYARIYKKEGEILIFGGVDTKQLVEQNKAMHFLNREISNLQRNLAKEKFSLENTLEKLQKAQKALEKLNSDKDNFISIIAHDLKNPFVAILGLTEELNKCINEKEFEDASELSFFINKSVRHTYNLLESLLKWARAESGKLPFNPQVFNLHRECNLLFESMVEVANTKNVSLHNKVDKELRLFADLEILKTILRNLLNNAIKFSSSGGEVSVNATEKEDALEIEVVDKGVGIPEKDIDKIFNVGEGYSTKGTNDEKGTGFGLMICNEFVKIHGGEIWIESELGVGTSIKFKLPRTYQDY